MQMLFAIASKAMEAGINTALKLDPDSRELLQPLTGKSMTVSLTDWKLNLTVVPTEDKLNIYLNGDKTASVVITGSSTDLMALGMSDTPQAVLSDRDIDVTGSLQVLMAYQKVMHQLNFDWQGALALLIGDVAAREVCRPVKATGLWAKKAAKSTRQDITEYLQEELQMLPQREAVNDFYEDIVSLQHRLARLEHLMAMK